MSYLGIDTDNSGWSFLCVILL